MALFLKSTQCFKHVIVHLDIPTGSAENKQNGSSFKHTHRERRFVSPQIEIPDKIFVIFPGQTLYYRGVDPSKTNFDKLVLTLQYPNPKFRPYNYAIPISRL